MHDIRTIGHVEATKAIEVIVAETMRRDAAVVVAVADAFGEIIAVMRMDGASLSSLKIAQHKAFTAAREGRPSDVIGRQLRDPERGYDIAFYGEPRYIGWGGGLPVIIDDTCAGGVSVSGLSEADDIELCQMAIVAITGRPAAVEAAPPRPQQSLLRRVVAKAVS